MAAEQATQATEANAAVVETRTIQQGLTAMLGYNPAEDLESNVEAMKEEIGLVKSGQVTFAVRDTEINGLAIKKDDFMGIIEGEIKVSAPDLFDVTVDTIKQMLDEDSEIVTILIGENGTEEEDEKLSDVIEEKI